MFQQDWAIKITEQTKDLITSHIDWLSLRQTSTAGPPVKMLDYACGNGAVSRSLLPYVARIRGVDVSDGMAEFFNELAREDNLAIERVSATQGDIMTVEPSHTLSEPEFFNFDFILLSMALHHMADPKAVVAKLVERLRGGGVLAIVDWAPDDIADEVRKNTAAAGTEVSETVTRHGLSAEDMAGLFVAAGCAEDSIGFLKNTETTHVPEAVTKVKSGMNGTIYIAKARKL